MADISLLRGTATGKGAAAYSGARPGKTIYQIVDLVKAAAVKGSALASADVIKALRIPAGTLVLTAGAQVIDVAADSAGTTIGTLNFDLGTAGDTTRFLAGTSFTTATYNAEAAFGTLTMAATNTSIDLTIKTFSGTAPASGTALVWAHVFDVSPYAGANINATYEAGVPQS